jgi:hypothetical protein
MRHNISTVATLNGFGVQAGNNAHANCACYAHEAKAFLFSNINQTHRCFSLGLQHAGAENIGTHIAMEV